ncbi:MAG: hypothetical protein ACOC2W_03090 [bacterium]
MELKRIKGHFQNVSIEEFEERLRKYDNVESCNNKGNKEDDE